jgi:hypothetical protein
VVLQDFVMQGKFVEVVVLVRVFVVQLKLNNERMKFFSAKILKFGLVILFVIINAGCENKGESRFNSNDQNKDNDILSILRYELRQFVDKISQIGSAYDQVRWEGNLKEVKFDASEFSLVKGLANISSYKFMSKLDLEMNFDSIGYYLDSARRQYVYNSVPMPEPILELGRELLNGKYRIEPVRSFQTYNRIRTISELISIINLVAPEKIISANVLKSYPKLSSKQVLSILLKDVYRQIEIAYKSLYGVPNENDYPPMACSKLRIVAPILNLDLGWKEDVARLEAVVPKLHTYLGQAEGIYGDLGMHLSCLEVVEEVLGKSPDPKTGEGLTERYIKFIAKYLWDYPFYARVCAPFGGVMSIIPVNKSSPDEFCRSNSKRVYDNLLLLHIIETYLPGAVIYNSDYAPKSVGVNVANLKGEKILKELIAMKEVKPSPAIYPSMSPSLKATPIGKKNDKK